MSYLLDNKGRNQIVFTVNKNPTQLDFATTYPDFHTRLSDGKWLASIRNVRVYHPGGTVDGYLAFSTGLKFVDFSLITFSSGGSLTDRTLVSTDQRFIIPTEVAGNELYISTQPVEIGILKYPFEKNISTDPFGGSVTDGIFHGVISYQSDLSQGIGASTPAASYTYDIIFTKIESILPSYSSIFAERDPS